MRDKIGSFKEREDMQRWLNEWIMNYVDADPVNSSQETKARRPPAAAEVVVEEVEGNRVITMLNSSCAHIFSLKG